MPMSLLLSRRLLPLMVTQTLGALNDNLFKNALVVLTLFRVAHGGAALVAVASGLFILPYAVFSATAGQLADRFEKSRQFRIVKGFEVLLMGVAAAGFMLDSLPLLLAVLTGLGVQATFFGPLKYGALPSLLAREELVAGNGLVEAGTFGGILAGTIGGTALVALPQGPAIVAAAGLAVALAGLAAAFAIPAIPSAAPDVRIGFNPWRETVALLGAARAIRPVWLCILGLSWFWVMGAVLVTELPTVARFSLDGDAHVITLMLLAFSVGVGVGSMLCPRLLRGEVTARPVPFVALGLSLFTWDFAAAAASAGTLPDVAAVLHSLAGARMLGDLLMIGVCGGIYSVPLYAIMQERAGAGRQSRMTAANNVMNAVAMVIASAVIAGLAAFGFSGPAILAVGAALNLAVAIWIIRLLPQEFLRGIFRWYFNTFHSVTVSGLEHLPPAGERAVIVVNHLSFADGCFVAAFLPGSPVFAVNIHTARRWWARPFLAAIRHFPVDPANPFATRTMIRAVQSGERLVIFPEGRITTTGALMKVYEGAGMVADRAEAVVVPVRIDGLQFTTLSRMPTDVRRRWFPRLSLTVMPPVRLPIPRGEGGAEATGRARRRLVGTVLQGVMEHSSFATAATGRTLFAALLDARDRFGATTPIAEDIAREPLNYRRLILGAVVLGRKLAQLAPRGKTIGVMLPNANGAVVTFLALQTHGRIPAMLNFSAGAEAMLSACTAAQVETVLSSRAFVERAKLAPVVARMEERVRFVWLEDIRAGIGPWAKLRGLIDAARARRLPGARGAADAPSVVLFTSGSEGTPKGVVLSHRNILANIAQIAAVVDFNPADRVFNAMPMFHAFGLTGGTLLPLLSGVRTFFYPSPLHYRIVPELIYDTDSTICFGTDTFLAGWARFAHPYDFYAIRYIFAGAERVREETRLLYARNFGARVLEGYGATETAPVLALNTAMHGRQGTAGRMLPGIEWRLEPVPGIERGARLHVKGPNIMLGYYRVSAPGVLEPPEDGWYDTGDIVEIDADGFVTIAGRAKRFAKIAGEMVSMAQAEALAAGLWPDHAHAVVARPDPRKGEQLVLLTTRPDAAPAALLAAARERGVAEIAVPRVLRVVDALPLLGSGKVDYVAAGRLADDRAVGLAA
jgi:acyl-[acyl-carrier-protein]-phospholipid O-acyltransferase/long-chain-fatty-acid--[acyl-carrier-protein] ligase